MVEKPPLDPAMIPKHVGIIMDGNGRWAKALGKPRTFGHREGLKAAKRVVRQASDMGLRYLSLYTFSTENWLRAQEEVSFLMVLIRTHLRKELSFYRDSRIRVIHSGDPSGIPADVLDSVNRVCEETAHFDGLTLNLAINYGGRDEIVRAVNRWLACRGNGNGNGRHEAHAQDGGSASSSVPMATLTIEDLHQNMDHPEVPFPDMIIRTGGEHRLSNFLLWEGAYAELFFSPYRWPDWDGDKLVEAIKDYQRRTRTFGGKR